MNGVDVTELNIPQEDWFEALVRYGLYCGAVFQIFCLCACVFQSGSNKDQEDSNDLNSNSQPTPQNTPKRPQKAKKQDKRKRR